jgi:hypothetical protein
MCYTQKGGSCENGNKTLYTTRSVGNLFPTNSVQWALVRYTHKITADISPSESSQMSGQGIDFVLFGYVYSTSTTSYMNTEHGDKDD